MRRKNTILLMSYANFIRDTNKYIAECKKNNISIGNSDVIIRDEWIANKKYIEFISFILENWNYGNCEDFSRPFSKHLIENKELVLFKRLWKGIIRNRLTYLWESYEYLKNILPEWTVDDIINISTKDFSEFDYKNNIAKRVAWERLFVIDGINEFTDGLKMLNDEEEIERQTTLLSIVSNLNKPKPGPTTDKRKIDENLFWHLIDEAGKKSYDQPEFIENLKSALESFNPKELRSFDKLLKTKANELNTWEHWALAYIVRGGCGDDAFDYFKAWAVSKGHKAFIAIKNIEEKELLCIFNEDPQLEELYYLAEQVYENKTSDLMPPVRVKRSKLVGKKWEEQNLPHAFPSLCKLFNYE